MISAKKQKQKEGFQIIPESVNTGLRVKEEIRTGEAALPGQDPGPAEEPRRSPRQEEWPAHMRVLTIF